MGQPAAAVQSGCPTSGCSCQKWGFYLSKDCPILRSFRRRARLSRRTDWWIEVPKAESPDPEVNFHPSAKVTPLRSRLTAFAINGAYTVGKYLWVSAEVEPWQRIGDTLDLSARSRSKFTSTAATPHSAATLPTSASAGVTSKTCTRAGRHTCRSQTATRTHSPHPRKSRNPRPVDIFGWPGVASRSPLKSTKSRMFPTNLYIMLAKRAGLKFTFGTDSRNQNAAHFSHCYQMPKKRGFTEAACSCPERSSRYNQG